MTNFEQQQDPRMRNGWAEYQRLVLAELERHNLTNLDQSVQGLRTDIALLKEQNGKIHTLQGQIDKLQKQVQESDTQNKIGDAISKYRGWILTTLLLLASSIIIPLVKLIFFGA
jgi:hypothetical protein